MPCPPITVPRFRPRLLASALLAAWSTGLGACGGPGPGPGPLGSIENLGGLPPDLSRGLSKGLPFDGRRSAVLADPAWYDGRAEVARYTATRTLYGLERRYTATLYTNVQRMDRGTSTKSVDGAGVEVFKQHRSERIPTENYDYDFSTAVFVERASLKLFKQTFASQEDCGATFKQLWSDGAGLRWFESSYFPGEGLRSGVLPGAELPQTFDGLPLWLRALPADAEPGDLGTIHVLPSWRDTHAASLEPQALQLQLSPAEVLSVPAGEFEARRLDLLDDSGAVLHSYWFSLESEPPMLGALLAYRGPQGESLQLSSLERSAYWERP